MHPVLIKIGPLAIHTYGVLVAAGFLAGIFLAMREARRKGIDPDRIMDLGLYILAAAIIGSRLMQVAIEYRYYLAHPLEIFMIWRGGLVFYGGFIMAAAVAIWYLRRHSLPVWMVGDILAPSIALGHSIGRLGCFSAGCCYGKPADLPWAVTFTDPECLAITGVPLHPSQLYESAASFAFFLFLYAYRKRTTFVGQLFWIYVLGYSVIRFMLEFLRGDVQRGFTELAGFHVSTSQAIGLAIFITSAVMLSRLKTAARKKRKV
jgi:phosphatidylglycerol:prolipoprotein diacylglycerol transferase